VQHNEALILPAQILSQGEQRDFAVMFRNMDEPQELSKWKFAGSHLAPENMSVYLPSIFQSVSGYNLNDRIMLAYRDNQGTEQTLEFTVRGYTEDIFFSSTDTGPLSFYLSEETYNQVADILNAHTHGGSAVHLLFVNLDDIANASRVANEFREFLGLNSASMMANDLAEMIVMLDIELVELSRVMMASMVSIMLVVFALIIVSVCLLVVRFRIVNSIEDDMVKIGSLKSAGYTSRQIIISILMQFGIIAGMGSIIGIALSYPVLPFVSRVFEQQSGLRWEQGFDGVTSSVAFAAVLLVIAAVSLIAARRVKNLSPIHALRGESSARKYKRSYLPLEKTSGILPIVLAFKSALQGLGQSIMILVIVAAVAFAGAYGIIMYYNTAIDTKAFAEVPGMEICNAIAVLNPQMDHTEILREIKAMPNVRKAQYLDEGRLRVDGADVSSFIMADYDTKETRLVYDGRYPEKSGEIVLAGILASRINKKVGDTVSVAFGSNGAEEIFTVTGLSNGSQMGGMNTSILTDDFKRLNPDLRPQALHIYLEQGSDAAEFVRILENSFDRELLRAAVDFDKALAEGMASYQNIVAMMGITMLIITLTVIALVLYFVISSSVIRRKRELGIQKAIGFTTGQLMNQIAVSFSVPVTLGVAAGSVLGAVSTNPMMSFAMQGMGVMQANFIVDPIWVTVFGVAAIIFSYLLSLAVTLRIRKISAYALVTE
jgi:putative ABC transport system permease protein